MRLEWLEDILAVLDTGSFHRAAALRFLTPSAFTRRVKSIEETLGCELFDRSKKPVELHPHALENVSEMRDAVASLKQLKLHLSQPDANHQGRVTLICQHVLTTSIAPQIVKLASQTQGSNIRIKTGDKHDCVVALVKRDAEFALTYDQINELPSLDRRFSERVLLGQDRFIPVVVTEQLGALRQQVITGSVPVIRYPSNAFLGEVQNRALYSLMDPGLKLTTVAETGFVLAVAEFVKQGLGIGWLPESIIGDELACGELTHLEDLLPACELDISLSRLSGPQSQSAEDFWGLICAGKLFSDSLLVVGSSQ